MDIQIPKQDEQIAIISDIHGNLAALKAVLLNIKQAGISRIWCLGDIMGYAPDAVACARLVMQHCELSLAGNHDLAILDKIRAADFGQMALEGIRHARAELSIADDDKLNTWLDTLKPKYAIGDIGLFHASPMDPIWHYVFTQTDALQAFYRLGDELQVCLVGHSHFQLAFIEPELGEVPIRAGKDLGIMDAPVRVQIPQRLLANPGSCGQPRNGYDMNPIDARVSWGSLVRQANGWGFNWHHLSYDIDKTVQRVLETDNLSDLIGSRLYPRKQ